MQNGHLSRLTLKQAADALQLSTRTLRRRIAEGALSATRELRGKREVVTIDGAELARYAESTGQTLTIAAVGAREVGQTEALAENDTVTSEGEEAALQVKIVALEAEVDKLRGQTAALAAALDFAQEIARNLSAKALPPAQVVEEAPVVRVPWWRRTLFGAKGERP